MIATSPTRKNTQVLWCICRNGDIPKSRHQEIREAITDSGAVVIRVADLCEAAARQPDRLKNAILAHQLIVIGCYPRAMRSLLRRAGIPETMGMRFFDQRTDGLEKIRDALRNIADDASPDLSTTLIDEEGDWIPWYPLVDRDRCKDCGQCASFCLFDVYEESEGRVRVVRPWNCKTNCPACARICPEAAIIFPRYGESPINGDEIADEESVKAKIRVDVDQILGDDVYAALAERRKKARGLKLRHQALEKARAERAVHATD